MPPARIPSPHGASIDAPVSSVHSNVLARTLAARARIEPRMLALYRHFTGFVERVGATPVPVEWSYAIEGAGALAVSSARGFECRADAPERPTQVSVRFEAAGTRAIPVLPPDGEAYRRLTAWLVRHYLRFEGGIAGNLCKVVVTPVVPVECLFHADLGAGVIRLTLINLLAIGQVDYALDPDVIDPPLMVAVEDLLLRRTTEFHEITRGARPRARG